MRIQAGLTGLVVLATASLGMGQDWPQFRGEGRMGIAKVRKVPVEWSTNKGVVWKRLIPGSGWSSPVLVGGKLYLTSAVEKGDGGKLDLAVFCVNAKSGQVEWRKDVFVQNLARSPGIHKKNGHASPTPLVEGGRIYVHFGHQGTACLNMKGEVVWKNETIKYPPVHGNGGSPVLVDGLLIFSCDGGKNPFVVALDAKTGAERWRKGRDTTPSRPFSFCTPLVIEVNGQKQVVLPGSDAVFAYVPRTGKVIWRVDYPGGYSVVPRPVYKHGLVYICTGFNRPSLLAIRPTGRGNVTETHVAWKMSRNVPHTPSIVVVGEELFMVSDSGIAHCLDAKTGKVHWRERMRGKYSSSLVYAAGNIYMQRENGEGVVVKASKAFKIVGRNTVGERTLASYAVSEGAIYVRSSGHLWRIEG